MGFISVIFIVPKKRLIQFFAFKSRKCFTKECKILAFYSIFRDFNFRTINYVCRIDALWPHSLEVQSLRFANKRKTTIFLILSNFMWFKVAHRIWRGKKDNT